MSEIAKLLERVADCTEADNALDIAIEVAIFTPDKHYAAVTKNAAGTKLIYTLQDGGKQTCWAWDWTLNPSHRAAATEALSALQDQRHEQ